MVIMDYSQEQMKDLWLKIDQLHLSYLQMEESQEKISQRTKLEDFIAEFLCIVPHKYKFVLLETDEVLYRSAAFKKDFSGYKAASGWNALQMYAGNLLAQPWRKEYHHLKTYCGFYKHQIEANLIGAETIFESMGYKHIGSGTLLLDGPICPDKVASVSKDCLVAYVECQIIKHIWEELHQAFNTSWLDILEYRRMYAGSPDQCIKNLKHKYLSKSFPEPARSVRSEAYENKYHPVSPTGQIPSQAYISAPQSHSHVQIPMAPVSYCMPPHMNGCHNVFPSYGYAPCNLHMPIVKHGLPPPVVPSNGYYYGNGYPAVFASPSYPIPTGQLIELEQRNTYDAVDAGSSTSRVRRSRTDSNMSQDNEHGLRNGEHVKNGKEEKHEVEEDWSCVYNNLERQGYSKDLGERGDLLALSVNDRQRKHSKEVKRGKVTNLDEAIKNLNIDGPLKMTEALEKIEQRSEEKVFHPKEQRLSQGSSYENVTKEAVKNVKAPEITPSQSKLSTKEKSERDLSKKSTISEATITKEKEKLGNKWECKSCTFLNNPDKDICGICCKSRNMGQEQPMEVGGAECSQCTLVNPRSAKKCEACGTSLKNSPTYI